MAKKSAIERDRKRRRMAKSHAGRRERLKEIASDRDLPAEERFAARLKLAELIEEPNATEAAFTP